MSSKKERNKRRNKIIINFTGSEILDRKISKFGTGAHVIVPKEHIDKNVKIIVEGDDE